MSPKRALRVALALAIGLCVSGVAPCAAQRPPRGGTGPDPVQRDHIRHVVDAVILPLMESNDIPGMAVGVRVDGRAYIFNYGVASRATQAPVTNATLFELGSVSKTLTATLASWAASQRYISLNDPLQRFVPALRGTAFGKTSLLELGTHTPGGLPLQVPDDVTDLAQLIAYLKVWKPTCTPGTCRTYTNIGIGMLGVAVARGERRSFVTLMQQQLLPALGMHHTWYGVPAAHMRDYAQGYRNDNAPIRMAPGVLDAEAYGATASATDVLRLVAANMGEVQLDARLQRAITATHTGYFTAEPMTQDLIWEQYPWPATPATLLAGNSPRMIFEATPVTRIAPAQPPARNVWINKTGSTNGFGAYVAFIPGLHRGIVLLANKNYPIADRVTAAYRILTRIPGRR